MSGDGGEGGGGDGGGGNGGGGDGGGGDGGGGEGGGGDCGGGGDGGGGEYTTQLPLSTVALGLKLTAAHGLSGAGKCGRPRSGHT